jgi:hypothetical protein
MASGATMRRAGVITEPAGPWGLTTPRGVYEALAPLRCASCRRVVAVGDRFTRRRGTAAGGQVSVCRACAPFEEAG